MTNVLNSYSQTCIAQEQLSHAKGNGYIAWRYLLRICEDNSNVRHIVAVSAATRLKFNIASKKWWLDDYILSYWVLVGYVAISCETSGGYCCHLFSRESRRLFSIELRKSATCSAFFSFTVRWKKTVHSTPKKVFVLVVYDVHLKSLHLVISKKYQSFDSKHDKTQR